MPELPEVETTCRGIAPIVGGVIERIDVHCASLRYPVESEDMDRLLGCEIKAISRRGKIIIIEVHSCFLLIHLGMTGNLVLYDRDMPLKKHDHVVFHLSNGLSMRYHDTRRFGYMEVVTSLQEGRLLNRMGPEPLSEDFSATYLLDKAKSRQIAIKQLIMDQQIVVGVGNIYATEALFEARVLPDRPAYLLKKSEALLLVKAIKAILQQAIQAGGTTLKDFISPEKKLGYFVTELAVYGREHLLCHKCSTTLMKKVISGRASVYCPRCQQ